MNFSETAELHALDVGHGQAEEELETPKSRYVGVSWHKKQRKWSAYVHHGGKKQSLGYFEKEDLWVLDVEGLAAKMEGLEGE